MKNKIILFLFHRFFSIYILISIIIIIKNQITVQLKDLNKSISIGIKFRDIK